MASLTKKIIRGRPFYYLRECQRVDGKPKIVWQQYLGSADDLVRRLEGPEPKKAVVREFGGSAACLDMARELEVVQTIDRHVSKRGSKGPTVGQYLLIAALNRCLAPRSKSRLRGWYEGTVLPRLLGVRPSQLSSQRFWDNMSRVDEQAIRMIERDLVQTVVSKFDLDLRCLLFDATNFFTFVDSFNSKAKLSQRGHSKEGRASLRIIGLALLVTADGEVPLLHTCYGGSQPDATTFGDVIPEIAQRCQALSKQVEDITIVFDKGNNSEDNLDMVSGAQLHFVGSLVPTQHKELLEIRRRQMRRLDPEQLPAVWSYRTTKVVFGVERTVIVTFNQALFTAQMKTLRRELNKRKKKLEALRASLARSSERRAGKKPTLEGTSRRVAGILSGRHMKDLFTAEVGHDRRKQLKLTWSFNEQAWKRLQETLLGKTILFTDRGEWDDEKIVRAYRSQSHVEATFRGMKDPHCLAFRPTYHWTDQKLRVHALYCVIAVMILSLLRRKLARAHVQVSLARMVERLSDVQEVAVLYHDADAKAPRARTVLSETDTDQSKLLEILELDRFVAS